MSWQWEDSDRAAERGRALRAATAHRAHAAFVLPAGRPTVQEFLAARSAGRMPTLMPLGHGRMHANPFAFFRGSAGLMAHDLAGARVTGVTGQICGDAHAANFGLYGARDGRIVMDINDFDETLVGPWEWDLKRLACSLVLASRTGVDAGEKASRKAARGAARAYRTAIEHLAALPFADSWMALSDESVIAQAKADELFDDFAAAASKAARNTSERVAGEITHRHTSGQWHFQPDPPILTEVDGETGAAVIAALPAYLGTLPAESRSLADRYRPRDVALRVVGTGSVGMRTYLLLLQGNGEEALILQVKQAAPSALAAYLPATARQHEGERIVRGARLVQADPDRFLGWTTIGGRPYMVRQFRNRKGSIDPTLLAKDHIDDYGRLAGALLGRAHSRSIDPRLLAGYLEDGAEFDEAIADFALAYAAQVEHDHAEMVDLVKHGRVEAAFEQH